MGTNLLVGGNFQVFSYQRNGRQETIKIVNYSVKLVKKTKNVWKTTKKCKKCKKKIQNKN